MELKEWIESNKLSLEYIDEYSLKIKGLDATFFILYKRDIVIKEGFKLNITDIEKSIQKGHDYYLFTLAGKWYYTKIGEKLQLNLFKYIGKCKQEIELDFPYLGIHSGYEILNGSRSYEDWIKKAKFYNYSTLGICERNTLSGTLQFQLSCSKNNIKSILGEEVTVKFNTNEFFDIKLYVINEIGWKNLLKVNKKINVDNCNFIDYKDIIEITKGLICVIKDLRLIEYFKDKFEYIYYQIDTVEWNNNDRDKGYLTNFKKYVTDYSKHIKPILINDSYYLDKDDAYIKKKLNNIGGLSHQAESNNQYFKNLDDNFKILNSLFKEGNDVVYDLFGQSIESLIEVNEICNFKIETGIFKLPKFKIENLKDEKYSKFKTNEELFFFLIEEGISLRFNILDNDKLDEYLMRVEEEVGVITKGGFIDYFLILWDIVRWCKDESKILTGVGRGCFCPDSKVLMKDGLYKNIQDIKVGDIVYNYFNKKSKVTNLFEYDINEEIIELVFENDSKIRCTKDHEIHTLNRGWVKAEDLNETDDINFVF